MRRLICFIASLAATVIASSQPTGLGSITGPDAPKNVIATKDLPADYAAFMFRLNSDSMLGDLFGSMFGGMMGIFQSAGLSSPDQQSSFKLLELTQASWTNGKMVSIGGLQFIAAYKLKLDAGAMSQGPKAGIPTEMELTYIRFDAIKAIVPRPDLTRDVLLNGIPSIPPTAVDLKTLAVSNYKQAAIAMNIYLSDYDDEIPYAQDSKSALSVLVPYTKNTEIFRMLNPNGGEIRLNMAIAGVNSSEVSNPAQTPLFFDSEPWPDGTRIVAFLDAHTKIVSDAEWKSLEPFLKLKLTRKSKPLPPFYYRATYPGGVPWDKPGDAVPTKPPPSS